MSSAMCHDETIVLAAGVSQRQMHTVTERILDSPLWLWSAVAIWGVVRLSKESRAFWRVDAKQKRAQPWWLIVCWILAGIAVDWRFAFEWFAGSFSVYSEPVLLRAGLIAVVCAIAASLMVWITSEARLRDAGTAFFVVSWTVYGFMAIHWAAHR